MPQPSPSSPRSAAASAAVRDWPGYFDAVGDGGPRETLVEALDRFALAGAIDPTDPPLAVDLGCGTGRDALAMLSRGWRVLAVDGEAEALDRMRARPEFAAYARSPRLATQVVAFEDFRPPPCRLLNASYALPFCPPASFDRLWRSIVTAIEPGGRFAGQFFGEQDDWAALPDRSHHTRDEVETLLGDFEIETLRTELFGPERDSGHPKRWHIFHVVARRRHA